MLNKSQLLKLLVDVAAVNDTPVLSEDRNLPLEICAPEDRGTVRRMAAMIDALLRSFDYLRSPEFEESVAGKSDAVAAMKRRIAADPMRRAEQRRRLEAALGEILSSKEVYSLLSRDDHAVVGSLIELANHLRNPSG